MMKAISLWQPWGSLMAVEAKRNETRGWWTGHRGELAICTAKRRTLVSEISDECAYWVGTKLGPERFGKPDNVTTLQDILDELPQGVVVCVVNMTDCVNTIVFQDRGTRLVLSLQEFELGNYLAGRFAWLTDRCRKLRQPVPVIGRQGLFNLPPEIEAAVRGQLGTEGNGAHGVTRPTLGKQLKQGELIK